MCDILFDPIYLEINITLPSFFYALYKNPECYYLYQIENIFCPKTDYEAMPMFFSMLAISIKFEGQATFVIQDIPC